ncbi:porin family protein [Parachryseolinea silvisoli]|jgi:hypothetical protein|uniref:porin family protein n=1 Tax=Parachryseolinea silvisoli TaxID=2873601 RepID=UPI0022658C22|nr:porin family protein [Parachryseolinea silvisoli]MCD9014936.1 PorT family protein [Parachryseolinea silvisoli]
MKKILLIGALVVAFQTTYAQVTLIPKAGLTSSDIKTKIDEPRGGSDVGFSASDAQTKLGFTVGVGINIPITKALSFQPEVSFIQKGRSAVVHVDAVTVGDIVIGHYDAESKLTLNYLEIPVLAKYTVSLAKGATQLFVVAGPSFALGVGGKLKQETTYSDRGVITTTSNEANVKFGSKTFSTDEYGVERRGDIGLQTGLGALLFKKIMIDVRYTFGMTKLWDFEDIDISTKNRVLQFTVGVPFTLKK